MGVGGIEGRGPALLGGGGYVPGGGGGGIYAPGAESRNLRESQVMTARKLLTWHLPHAR